MASMILLIVVAERAPNARSALYLGWVFGFGHFVIGLYWVAQAFHYQSSLPVWAGWLAVPLLAAYLAIFPALALMLGKKLAPDRTGFRLLILPASWILSEWTRGWLFTGFAWNPLGVIWIDVPIIAQLAQAFGAIGLSGLTILLAGLLLETAAKHRLAFVAIATVTIGAASSPWRPVQSATRPGPITVRIVQPNIAQDKKWRTELSLLHRRQHIALSGSPRRDGGTRWIFWPEAAIGEELQHEPQIRKQLAETLGPRDLLFTGGIAMVRSHQGAPLNATNSVFVVNSEGQIVGRYDKSHLVPFGEYVPSVAKWLGLSRFASGAVEFTAGPGARSLNLPGFPKVGVDICYEMTFPGQVVDRAQRPAFIFNPSNDAWFGTRGPPQHLAQARMRAIEEGLPVIRSTSTGISAVIRKDGSVAASLPLGTAGFIDTPLPPAGAPTLFSQWGHDLSLALAGLFVFISLCRDVGKRRYRDHRSTFKSEPPVVPIGLPD